MPVEFDKDLAQKLCDLEFPNRIKFSPDGTKVLYSTALQSGQRTGKNSLSTIWLASSTAAGSSRKLTAGSANDRLPTWLPDGNRVAFISDRSKPGKHSAIWMLRLDGGDATAITPADNAQAIGDFAVSPDGSAIAYLSADERSEERKKKDEDDEPDPDVWGEQWEHARLRLVDVESKESKVLVGGDRHVTGLGWSPDGNSLVFESARNPDIEEGMLSGTTISTIDVKTGAVKDLYTAMNNIAGNIIWGHDGKLYYVSATPENRVCAARALYSLDLSEETPKPVKVSCGVDDDAGYMTMVGGKVLLCRDFRLSAAICEVGGRDLFTRDTSIRAWDVYFDPKNGGNPTLAATSSSINSPYEVYIVKEGQEDVKLSNHGKALEGKSFGSCTVLKSKSSDGLEELDALYLTPSAKAGADGKPKEPLPTVVMIHGGPTARNCATFDASYFNWPPYLLSMGYGLLLPQYRGSSCRGDKFAAYSIGGVGDHDYSDVISITDNAIKAGFADAKNLMVGGWSQGGLLTYMCSARNGLHDLGWRFNATIAGAGICDMDSLALTSDMGSKFEAELVGDRVAWMTDKTDTAGRKGSALWEVSHAINESHRRGQPVIPPMLILHGKSDERCPVSQAMGYRRALRQYGLPCEFVLYPGEGHVPKPQRFWLDMLERVGRWCHTYIGPGQYES